MLSVAVDQGLDSSNLVTNLGNSRTNCSRVRLARNENKELELMSGDDERSEKLENKASELIDQSASDEARLDEAAEILAEAERLKGPLDKSKKDARVDKQSGSKD